jgi:M6 family metalloprotease-like protein
LTVSSALTGSNGVIINDVQGGTVVLTGPRSYSGATVVSSGTLRVHGNLNGTVSIPSGGTLAPGPASGIGSLTLNQALTVDGSLSMRINRADAQKADLLIAPSIVLNGNLTVVNVGGTLQNGDTFQLFSASGGITRNGATLTLPALPAGLSWDFSGLLVDGTLMVTTASNVIGDPNWPDLLPSQLQAARDAGHASAVINPGTYELPDRFSYQASFYLDSWSNFTVDATDVVLIVGKQRAFELWNCTNVTIKGATIRARYQSATQGRVLSKGTNPNGRAFAIWKISDGYPVNFAIDESYVPTANEVRAGFAINAVNGTTGIIDHATGDNYNCILTPQGNNTWKVDFPLRTSLPFQVNDWLVTRIASASSQSHGVFLNNSTNCTIESVTSQGGGFATFYEIGGGGNRLLGSHVETSPVPPAGGTELPVVSCSADGVHTRDSYPGMHIENCSFTGVLLDDCVAIHGFFQTVTAVSGNTITVSGLGMLKVGDPVRISTSGGYFAQANCTAILDLGGNNYRLTLNQTLSIPVGAQVSNPKYNGDGFRIINCEFEGTRSRAVITKADNGVISGCSFRNASTAIKIGPEYYWNESDYSWNVVIEGNVISDCRTGVLVASDGARGNKNIVIRNNAISTFTSSYNQNGSLTSTHAISLSGCDGVTITDNTFGVPDSGEAMRFENCNDITLANNLAAWSPTGKNILRIGSGVTSLQGAANGVLYSGSAYALTNSLSSLQLANPSSNATGDPVQQFAQSNASGHWFLQPDGNGRAKVLSAVNGFVLGVNNSSSSGTPLILETDGAGEGQLWTLKPVGTSAIELVNQLSGLSATVQTTAPMETVNKAPGTSAPGQLWTPALNPGIVQNHAPVIDSISADSANLTLPATTTVHVTASDVDGDDLSYNWSLASGPAAVTFGTGNAADSTVTFTQLGTYTLQAVVTDGNGGEATDSVSITVNGVQVFDYPATTPGSVKTFKVALLMINTRTTPLADNPVTKQLEFYTPEKLGQIFFEHEHGAASFIKEASYGKIALEGRVVGWLDQPTAGLNGTDISSNAGQYISLANDYLTFSDYDVFIVHSLVEGSGQQTGWLYPQQSFNTPQGLIQNIGITWMANSTVFDFAPLLTSNWSSGDSVLPTTSWTHELLHTFGITGHANSYDCGTSTLDLDSASDPLKAYGGVFSIMGEYAFGTHPDALMKSRIGWLTPAQIPEVTSTGTYEIHPLAVNDGQTKALVIPLATPISHSQNPAEFDALVVEYRTATGFDRYLERLNGSPFLSQYTTLTDIDTNGVVVYMRYASTATDATALLDMNPTTTFRADRGIKIPGNAGKFADAILPVNSTFSWDNIRITPLGTTEAGAMRVNITITPPSAYVAWTQRTFANPFTDVGTEMDPDGDGLKNFMEFAFGTDPTIGDVGALAADGSVNGLPMIVTADGGADHDLWFVRRDDHGTSGSIRYTAQFSGDLVTFHDSAATPVLVMDSVDDPDYEVVKIPYPEILPDGTNATFGRIRIILEP